jgi:hypothetical protein
MVVLVKNIDGDGGNDYKIVVVPTLMVVVMRSLMVHRHLRMDEIGGQKECRKEKDV